MRLASVEIRDFRSIFIDDAGNPLRLDLAEGANTLVGQNNCGKSNVLRAISLALDPHHDLDPDADSPGPRPFAQPIITLGFTSDAREGIDADALAAASAFERSLGVASEQTAASRGAITLEVSFVPDADGVRRAERLVTASHVPPEGNEAALALMQEAIAALRATLRFVLIRSGESLESVLEGNFREILHTVVRQRLHAEFETAEASRQTYVTGLQDNLLRPLRDRLAADVGGMFPEIESIGLSPDVSDIERTLSNVGVTISDLVTTPLSGKGTGVRGGVLVAMLSYLAGNATNSMVFAVEEPEAFLHPAAQEDLRDHLETMAKPAGVTLLVTTHSPFTVTRSAAGRVFCLAKDSEGRTRIAEAAAGNADHAPLIGGLLRQASLESVLQSVTALPPGTQAVVLVEGQGDRICMELVAQVIGRPDLLEGLHIRPSGGTVRILAEAVIVRAAVDVPVVVVLDNDPDGRDARKSLTGDKFNFTKASVLSYAEAFGTTQWSQFPVEAEDLFDPALMAAFVEEHGAAVIQGSKKRPDDAFHYDLCQASKEVLEGWLRAETRPEHVERWIDMLLLIRSRAGLSNPTETAAELIKAAPESLTEQDADTGAALIVAGQHDYARYLETSALLLDVSSVVPAQATHVGFYAKAVQPHVPRILATHPHLLISPTTAGQLRGTGKAADVRTATVIEHVLKIDPTVLDTTRKVLLLSEPTSPETRMLATPVKNTKEHRGRPVAWTVGPKLVPLAPLCASPTTTDELDAAISTLAGNPEA